MNDVIEMPRREAAGLAAGEVHRLSASEIRERVNLVQQVMQAIMKKDTHYGTIPGTPKPTLYKPGAEVLCVTFRVAPKYRVEDLSTDLVARFRVTCLGVHQTTNIELGEGVGECSSAEEKYKWRASLCAEEFDYFPESMRRVKFAKYNGDIQKKTQVRTEAADLSNTVLKMACKRAMIAMTLNVTAASDIFTQDIEDMPEELRSQEAGGGEPLLSPLAQKWIIAANDALTADALTDVWKSAVKEINSAKDAVASEAVKAVVASRGAALKAMLAETAKTKPQPSDEMERLIADLELAAETGTEGFDKAWGSLSTATQDLLADRLSKFKEIAEKNGGAQ